MNLTWGTLLAGLEVDAARMRASLDVTGGLIVSEAVMMGLAPHLGRQRAHDLVYDICRRVARPVGRFSIYSRKTPRSRRMSRAPISPRSPTRQTISGSPA
jgi:3-carboxy-cis,cis-muconate cycloisomerase